MPRPHPLGQPAKTVRLFISDVDGTLVTPDKVVTRAVVEAAGRVRAAGIAFALTSSRPPRGLQGVVGALGFAIPVAGFNGGRIVAEDGTVIEERLLPPASARAAVEIIEAHGADAWVFVDDVWLVKRPDGPHVAREIHTVGFDPEVVHDFGRALDRVGKIVGVSDDHPLLANAEAAVRQALDAAAAASRSQLYYLDVTHPEATKGTAVRSLAGRFGVPLGEMAVIGDMENDVAMFIEAGLAVAMGNALPMVREKADFISGSNREDGWAQAVERFILPRAPAGAR